MTTAKLRQQACVHSTLGALPQPVMPQAGAATLCSAAPLPAAHLLQGLACHRQHRVCGLGGAGDAAGACMHRPRLSAELAGGAAGGQQERARSGLSDQMGEERPRTRRYRQLRRLLQQLADLRRVRSWGSGSAAEGRRRHCGAGTSARPSDDHHRPGPTPGHPPAAPPGRLLLGSERSRELEQHPCALGKY